MCVLMLMPEELPGIRLSVYCHEILTFAMHLLTLGYRILMSLYSRFSVNRYLWELVFASCLSSD